MGKIDSKFICWVYCARQSSLLHLCQPKMFSHPKIWLSCSVPLQSSYLEHKQSHELLFVLCPAVTKCMCEGKGEYLGWPKDLKLAGLQLLRFLKDDEYPNLESINKDRLQRGKKKNQGSLFLKCAEILSNLASSKHRISWTPQLEPRGPMPLLKCSLPRKRGIRALQSSGVIRPTNNVQHIYM